MSRRNKVITEQNELFGDIDVEKAKNVIKNNSSKDKYVV